ncbi:MAG: hypothetical protein LBR06_03685 [Bacteroidales bacterium]|jgi:hypothetical protein|nr:hypothetical protein [Bacteroidales bacterium]
MKKCIAIIAILRLCTAAVAQPEAPEWYRHKPASLASNVTFGVGSGHTEQEAFYAALIDGIGASASMQVPSQSLSDFNNGLEITLPGTNKKVRRNMVERAGGMVYMLIDIQKNVTEPANFDSQEFSTTYNFSPRVFVPGLAQLHKGSRIKGVLFIAGEAALVGGIVAFEGLRASYESKIDGTHSASEKQKYIDNADNAQNIRNGLIAGAAVLYVWNIIDGIAAKGNLHLRLLSNTNLRITPYAAPQNTGLTMTWNF